MAGNYEKGMYNQLMEVMARLDTVERESRHEISRLNDEITDLKKDNCRLREENQLLSDAYIPEVTSVGSKMRKIGKHLSSENRNPR